MEANIKVLCQQIEKCQFKGAYSLKDAFILKECLDLFETGKCSNNQLNKQNALDVVIQALNIAQSKGCFNLNEAHFIFSKLQELEMESNKVEQTEQAENTESGITVI